MIATATLLLIYGWAFVRYERRATRRKAMCTKLGNLPFHVSGPYR